MNNGIGYIVLEMGGLLEDKPKPTKKQIIETIWQYKAAKRKVKKTRIIKDWIIIGDSRVLELLEYVK